MATQQSTRQWWDGLPAADRRGILEIVGCPSPNGRWLALPFGGLPQFVSNRLANLYQEERQLRLEYLAEARLQATVDKCNRVLEEQ